MAGTGSEGRNFAGKKRIFKDNHQADGLACAKKFFRNFRKFRETRRLRLVLRVVTAPHSPAIPNHQCLRRIGRGGFGEVWLARTVTGKFRAVKIIHRERFATPALSQAGIDALFGLEFEGVRRFEDIAAAHPGLVSILSVGRDEAGGFYYYVMPLADPLEEGSDMSDVSDQSAPSFDPATYRPASLEARIGQSGGLAWDESVRILAAVARGAAALHEAGFRHGDISSSNVLFVDACPVLGDPGLTSLEAEELGAQSPGFSDPGGQGRSGLRSDVFALGRLFYHMVSGRHPVEAFPLVPPEKTAALPLGGFGEFLDRCCDPDPENRFADAGELVSWLEKHFPDIVGPAPPKPVPRWRRLAPWLLAAAGLAAAAALGWIVWNRPPFGGLPSRGLLGAPDVLPEAAVWRYAVVAEPEAAVPPGAWRYGRGPFTFGSFESALPERLSFVPGKSGRALRFDNRDAGVHTLNGFVEMPPVPGECFTVAAWVRIDADALTSHAASVWEVGMRPEEQLTLSVDNKLHVFPNYMEVRFAGKPGKGSGLSDNAFHATRGEWHHLAVSVSPQWLRFYVDGRPHGKAAFRRPPKLAGSPVSLGLHQWTIGRATRFCGAIEEFVFVPTVLPGSAIAALATTLPPQAGAGASPLLDCCGTPQLSGDGSAPPESPLPSNDDDTVSRKAANDRRRARLALPPGTLRFPLDGDLAEAGGRRDLAFFRDGHGFGTKVPARQNHSFLVLETEFDVPAGARLDHPFLDIFCPAPTEVILDGKTIVRHCTGGQSGNPISSPTPEDSNVCYLLDPVSSGTHSLRVVVARAPRAAYTHVGVSLRDFGKPVDGVRWKGTLSAER